MKKTLGFPAMIAIAAALFVTGLFIHVPTALGQGITEHVITGWQGEYEADSGQFFLRVDYAGSAPAVQPATKMPLGWFVHKGARHWTTVMDDPRVLAAEERRHRLQIETILGTSDNVASLSVIFPNGPVGYAISFLKSLTVLRINPAFYGGPDIPPGSVPYRLLSGGELHIDTQANNNTLRQCLPGQAPTELTTLLQHP